MNDLNTNTNGEAKTDEPKNPLSLDTIERLMSSYIGKLVQHHVQKAVKEKFEAVVLVNDQLEGEVDELKTQFQTFESYTVNDLINDTITERLDERDAERDDAEDASEYVKIEDLADAVRDCFANGDVTFNVDVS